MSSLVFLGFSVIAFLISFGVVFMLAPIVLGAFFDVMHDNRPADATWAATADDVEAQAQWLIPVMMMLGMFIFIIKVLMTASGRGRD